MLNLSPFYMIPLLIEQPTWGGKYIANFKNLRSERIAEKNIGQSYELFTDSYISYFPGEQHPYAWASASNIAQPEFIHRPSDIQTLQSVIEEAPRTILGKKAVSLYGASMQVLIKFTQAQNNSYQVHVKPDNTFGKWQAKPESWYFLEPGKATLGLAPNCNVEEYKKRSVEIEHRAKEISARIQAQEISVEVGREELQKYIDQKHPRMFVNTIAILRGQTIDLSTGGIHHSWEKDARLPAGNIVYEVQKNVMDEFCTLRSFDQGNIKNDGSVRPITIDEYFHALDTEPSRNDPVQYSRQPASHIDGNATVTPIFQTPFYSLTRVQVNGRYGGLETENRDSFHHLFVEEGEIEVVTDAGRWPVKKGWSLFVPAAIEGYQISASGSSSILRTNI